MKQGEKDKANFLYWRKIHWVKIIPRCIFYRMTRKATKSGRLKELVNLYHENVSRNEPESDKIEHNSSYQLVSEKNQTINLLDAKKHDKIQRLFLIITLGKLAIERYYHSIIKYACLKPGANTILNIEHRGKSTKVRTKIRMPSIPTVFQFSSRISFQHCTLKEKKWGVNTIKVGESQFEGNV